MSPTLKKPSLPRRDTKMGLECHKTSTRPKGMRIQSTRTLSLSLCNKRSQTIRIPITTAENPKMPDPHSDRSDSCPAATVTPSGEQKPVPDRFGAEQKAATPPSPLQPAAAAHHLTAAARSPYGVVKSSGVFKMPSEDGTRSLRLSVRLIISGCPPRPRSLHPTGGCGGVVEILLMFLAVNAEASEGHFPDYGMGQVEHRRGHRGGRGKGEIRRNKEAEVEGTMTSESGGGHRGQPASGK